MIRRPQRSTQGVSSAASDVYKRQRVNCVLCTSSDNVTEPYNKAVDETRSFMNSLCAGTDGLMLVLSYPEIRTALINAGSQPQVDLQKIEPIEAIDLAVVRRDSLKRNEKVKRVNLAVIPHMSLASISFDPSHPAVQVSTALRTRLAKVPGVRVASPQDCLLYTSPSPRDQRGSRMPSSA